MARKLLVSFNDETAKMLEEIQARTGSPSSNAAVNFAIFEAHRALFPSYLAGKGTGGRSKGQKEQERRAEEQQELLEICKELEGTLEGEGANKICVYYTYNLRKRYEQRVSLDLLTKEMISGQYQPSKKAVLKLKEEGKTDW